MKTSTIVALCSGALIAMGMFADSMAYEGRLWACGSGISFMFMSFVIGTLEERNGG